MAHPQTVDELTRRNVELIARMQHLAERDRTTGERIADAVASTVGSWPFIITQSVLLIGWVILNLVAWFRHWDPYPFILLNLALSFQAAYASPIIMMSQNRAAKLADHRNQLDLQLDLLGEQENTQALRLLTLLCQHAGIKVEDRSLAVLEQATHPDHMLTQIEEVERKASARKREIRRKHEG